MLTCVTDCLHHICKLRLQSKKWCWNLFSNAINHLIVTVFMFYCLINKTKLNHFQFRRKIVGALAKSEKIQHHIEGPTALPSNTAWYHGVNQYPPLGKPRRFTLCKGNTLLSCTEYIEISLVMQRNLPYDLGFYLKGIWKGAACKAIWRGWIRSLLHSLK